jgi:phage-related protein
VILVTQEVVNPKSVLDAYVEAAALLQTSSNLSEEVKLNYARFFVTLKCGPFQYVVRNYEVEAIAGEGK